jgi:hypothetical protein
MRTVTGMSTDVEILDAVGDSPDDNLVAALPDEEMWRYARARILLRIRWLHDLYYRLLREKFGQYVAGAQAVARQRRPSSPELVDRARNAVLVIGGYQVWDDVVRDQSVVDRVLKWAAVGALAGTVFATVTMGPGWSPWTALHLVMALLSAAVVLITAGLLDDAYTAWSLSTRRRTALGLCGLAALGAITWVGSGWTAVWSGGIFAGLLVALAVLLVVATVVQIGRLAISLMYRYTWSVLTTDDIVETLACVQWWLRRRPADGRVWAVQCLDHVAVDVECRLGRALGVGTGSGVLQPQLDGMAATVRELARDVFVASASPSALADRVSTLLTAGLEQRWGDWPVAAPDPNAPTVRQRQWTSLAGRFLVGALPLAALVVAALWLNTVDPGSKFLDADWVVGLSGAALTFLGSVLAGQFSRANPGSGTAKVRRSSSR